jgi:predicted enzyme related to lactoylglutathione lyase
MGIFAINGIAVIFTVKDLARTRAFYADALGIPLEAGEGFLSAKLPGNTELVFFEGEASVGTTPQIVFGLENGGIDDAAEALAARGVSLITPVSEAPGGWSVEFRDPDGHPLAYYQEERWPRKR